MSSLCARLDKHDLELFRLLLALLGGDLALVIQIGLVANEHDNHVVAALATDIVNPFGGIHEGGTVGDVVDYNCDARVSDVGRDKGAKTFLPGGVPEL